MTASVRTLARRLVPLLAAGGAWSCVWSEEPLGTPPGEPPLVVTVGARDISLRPRQSQRLDAQARATEGTPPGTSLAIGYRSADSCIAAVSADGVVTAGHVGSTIVEAFARAAPLTTSAVANVRVPNTPGLPLTIQSVTAGDPPTLVDITRPVSGTFTVTVSVGAEFAAPGARLDLRLGGQLVGSAPIVASRAGDVAAVRIAIDGAARNPSTGARLVADGVHTLRATVVVPPVPGNAGCAPLDLSTSAALATLWLRNP